MLKSILTLSLTLALGSFSAFAQNDNPQNKELRHPDWGDNIIRVNPINIVDIGVGPAISYERIISKDKKFSFILPLSLQLENRYNYYNGYYGPGSYTNYFTYVYFTPGIKFYPFGQRDITYAIGTNLLMGYGGGTTLPNQPTDFPRNIHYFRLGILVNNYVNFQISSHFSLGLTFGLGARYLDHKRVKYENPNLPLTITTTNKPISSTGQFSFSLGYRF